MKYIIRRAISQVLHSELGLDFGPALKLRLADFKHDLDLNVSDSTTILKSIIFAFAFAHFCLYTRNVYKYESANITTIFKKLNPLHTHALEY